MGDPVTLNGSSPEIWYLSDSAQGLCIPEGNIVCSVIGERQTETRGRRPIRITHRVNQATSETLRFLIDRRLPIAIDRVCPRSGISDKDK